MPDAHSIAENLGRIFRFLLPGIVIVALAWASQPNWFLLALPLDTTRLALLTVIAIAVGNTWYVFHRYIILQLLDLVLYSIGVPGPAWSKGKFAYWNAIAEHVVNSFTASDVAKRAQDALATRVSHVLFMYLVSEAALLFSICPESKSVIAEHHPEIVFWVGIVGLIGATCQELITRRIDYVIVKRYGGGQSYSPCAEAWG